MVIIWIFVPHPGTQDATSLVGKVEGLGLGFLNLKKW